MALMKRSTDTILLMFFDLFFTQGESYRLKVLLHILYSLLTCNFFFPCGMEITVL